MTVVNAVIVVFFFENLKYRDCIMEKGSPEYALDGIDCSA